MIFSYLEDKISLIMQLYDYIIGKGGLMLLALVVVFVLLFRKYKQQRYFKYIDRKEKERKSRS